MEPATTEKINELLDALSSYNLLAWRLDTMGPAHVRLFDDAARKLENAGVPTTDSRNMIRYMREGKADLVTCVIGTTTCDVVRMIKRILLEECDP